MDLEAKGLLVSRSHAYNCYTRVFLCNVGTSIARTLVCAPHKLPATDSIILTITVCVKIFVVISCMTKIHEIFSMKEATIYEIYYTTEKLTRFTNYQHCARHALRAYMSGDILNFLNSVHFTCLIT